MYNNCKFERRHVVLLQVMEHANKKKRPTGVFRMKCALLGCSGIFPGRFRHQWWETVVRVIKLETSWAMHVRLI